MDHSRFVWTLSLLVIGTLAVGQSASAADGTVSFRLCLRDSRTGAAVVCDSLLVDGQEMAKGITPSGRIDLHVSPGDHRVIVRAKGYRELAANETAVQGDTPLNVLLLDPENPPSGLRPQILGLFWQPNATTIAGYVTDDETGQPLEGAEVSVAGAGVIASTDSLGFFVLTISVGDGVPVPGDMQGTLFAKKALCITRAGYNTQIRQDVVTVAGETQVLQLRLTAGSSTDVINEQDGRGKLLGGLFDDRPPVDEASVAAVSSAVVASQATPEPLGQAGPTTIRVGRNCPTKTTCSTVATMSMDTYVKHVLPAEWFSSWNGESLKAGAVAIRSYGGWYVYHPLTSTYDICDTTSCQVYKDGTASSTNDAVDATTGVYVVDASGNIARSEYSAENNKSCGDCYITNNPSAACLYDPVCCGTTLNGHGRGMCQWGTQRWATNEGKTYTWIVDHYYTNFGWTRQNLSGPVVTQQPLPQSVCSGGVAAFTVAATGSGTLTYRWQKNDVNLSNGGHYAGVTTTTLTVSSVSSADVANYRCVVTDSVASANSDEATLTLEVATTITQHPAARAVCRGATATFSVAAAGDRTVSHQWQKDGASLVNGGHYSGVTTATLTVSSTDEADAAAYRCVVTAGCGSATSGSASLTLLAATSISQQPQGQTVDPSGSATFTVVASGEGALTYQWQKDGADLSEGGHYAGTTLSTLTVSNAGSGEQGGYRCVVTAGCGAIPSAAAALTVHVAPGDFDEDADVDLNDFSFLQMCFSGPNRPPPYPECVTADLDADNDVDLGDFAAFQACFNGPNQPPACP